MRCRSTGVQRRILGLAARSWAPSPGVSKFAPKLRLLMAHRQVRRRATPTRLHSKRSSALHIAPDDYSI
eukprot:7957448-Heterocapsa_arctica.AAC.1